MAQGRDQQGTGRHPHKSSEEPYPHTKDDGAQHGRSQGSDDNRSRGGGGHGRSHETQSHGGDHDRGQEADLKRHEYRGEDGEIHHHTRTYMEQHGGDNRSQGREHAPAGSDNRSHGRDNNGSDRRR